MKVATDKNSVGSIVYVISQNIFKIIQLGTYKRKQSLVATHSLSAHRFRLKFRIVELKKNKIGIHFK